MPIVDDCEFFGECSDRGAGGEGIELASSVQKNTPMAQYYPIDPITEMPISGNCSENWGCNLCGFIVLSIILEHENPAMRLTLKKIWMSIGGTKKPVGGATLIDALKASFPSDQLWSAKNYAYSSFGSMIDNIIQVDTPLDRPWFLDSNGNNNVKSIMMEAFAQSHYLVPLVTIDNHGNLKESGIPNHWVLVTDMTEEHVTIINPFQNRYETLSWEDFLKSMENEVQYGSYFMLELWRSKGYDN